MNDPAATSPTLFDRALVLALSSMRKGSVTAHWPSGATLTVGGAEPGPEAHIKIRSRNALRRLLTGGGIALAEGYMDGDWDTPDLQAVFDWGTANVSERPLRVKPVGKALQRVRHALRDNTRTGSRKNIEYHYDLGNDFYELWLDETLTYSCALEPSPDEPLERAQVRKWDRLLDLLQPSSNDHLLEIGCGWGGFAIHAAREAGCKVTGLTLSREQARAARARVEEAALEGKVDIRLEDYRDVRGTFTGIASIEMFEAVGERWWPVFFGRVRELLAPGSAAALQTITIADDRFENYRDNPDFIQRYIFPGGMLPSPERFSAAARAQGLSVGSPHFFGKDYARTLEAWAERFESALPQVRALGLDERFIRMWRYYLGYCRAGFDSGIIDVMQVRLEAG